MSPPILSPRLTDLALWEHGRHMLPKLFNLWGQPQEIAGQNVLTRKIHQLLLPWLHAAEALLRHLLLLEARAMNLPALPQRVRAKRERKRKLVALYPDQPDDWRVSFRCFPAKFVEGRKRTARPRKAWTPSPSAWPIALRFEALYRVVLNPTPVARRLARRLARDAAAADRLVFYPPNCDLMIDEDKRRAIDVALGFAPDRDSS